ncbi:6-phosphogluconate dehydrogenase, NADP-binding [Cynara cardunculus var. scolymus]|uniref:6-phosphogluconate dehydrogenase, NADP-binding n=1 Tax=Cynara cardunculus var. scolymus TaxID=59895 RepID=A0A103YKK5_CYNCS|nr:6-phosphogluconate dehydrogenase, NADP-binding [Cynara cardunculus var. scolymus]
MKFLLPSLVLSSPILLHNSDVFHVLLRLTSVALSGLSPNGIFVNITTSEPLLAVEIVNSAVGKSCFSIDALVSGEDRGVRDAALSIFAGGNGCCETIESNFLLFRES